MPFLKLIALIFTILLVRIPAAEPERIDLCALHLAVEGNTTAFIGMRLSEKQAVLLLQLENELREATLAHAKNLNERAPSAQLQTGFIEFAWAIARRQEFF